MKLQERLVMAFLAAARQEALNRNTSHPRALASAELQAFISDYHPLYHAPLRSLDYSSYKNSALHATDGSAGFRIQSLGCR